MSSWARMQPVGKSGQSEQTGFLTRMGIAVIESPTGIGLGSMEPPFSILGSSLITFEGCPLFSKSSAESTALSGLHSSRLLSRVSELLTLGEALKTTLLKATGSKAGLPKPALQPRSSDSCEPRDSVYSGLPLEHDRGNNQWRLSFLLPK